MSLRVSLYKMFIRARISRDGCVSQIDMFLSFIFFYSLVLSLIGLIYIM